MGVWIVLPKRLNDINYIGASGPAVTNQPAADHGPGTADTGQAMDIDRAAGVEGRVNGIEDGTHADFVGDIHVTDGKTPAKHLV